jgi:hypothetical protein
MELCDIPKYVSSLELEPKHHALLVHFAANPATSAYEYATPLPLRSAEFSSLNDMLYRDHDV